jgi:hypothetical protein
MTAAIADEPSGTAVPDSVTAGLAGVLGWIGGLVDRPVRVGVALVEDGVRIDRIAVAEQLKAALEALQAVEMVAFARSQVAEQRSVDVDPRRVGRRIADQIALACKATPERFQPGINLRLGGERPDLEALVKTLYRAMYQSIAAHSRLGVKRRRRRHHPSRPVLPAAGHPAGLREGRRGPTCLVRGSPVPARRHHAASNRDMGLELQRRWLNSAAGEALAGRRSPVPSI